MSVEAITWALRVPVPASSAKFVLVVLANQANDETGHAFPSVGYLASATGQDRKTVLANLAKLIEWGLIEDTGKRVGRTGRVIVYRLIRYAGLFDADAPEQSQKRDEFKAQQSRKRDDSDPSKQSQKRDDSRPEQSQKRNSSENGTVPFFLPNSPVFPCQWSQKRDWEPSVTLREPALTSPARERAGEGASAPERPPAHEDPEPVPLHQRVLETVVELRKQGIDDASTARPDLVQVVEDGATAEQLLATAEELTARRQGRRPKLAYVIATLRGRAEDAATAPPTTGSLAHVAPIPPGGSARRETAHERAERSARRYAASLEPGAEGIPFAVPEADDA
ncbi:MAG TPA: helix-turn-helix domain-containing protein [Rhodanobacteraceae bacterium]|nr:helix-turn-helix domain-containing protein [Rhodanobacteraceae bacterium]